MSVRVFLTYNYRRIRHKARRNDMNDNYVFISYSRKNEALVKKIVQEIEEAGQHVFIDYRDIPPGKVFAAEIVNAIENAMCCVLMLSDESNNSSMVLNEVNSATNHDKIIIPLILDSDITLSKAMEFYIGKNNWVEYVDKESLVRLLSIIKSLTQNEQETEIKYPGPIVLSADEISKIGYDAKRKVVETVEIDYLTLNESPDEFIIDTEIEGSPEAWIEYANNYPETASFLIVNDKIVGYSQIELINRQNFDLVISGAKMIDAEMEEFYGFGGDFCCYITIMPIIKQYETQKNYVMLLDDLFAKFERLANEEDVRINALGISVYSNLLEKMLAPLGFKHVGNNPAKGKIFNLDFTTLKDNAILKRKYPGFYNIYGN